MDPLGISLRSCVALMPCHPLTLLAGVLHIRPLLTCPTWNGSALVRCADALSPPSPTSRCIAEQASFDIPYLEWVCARALQNRLPRPFPLPLCKVRLGQGGRRQRWRLRGGRRPLELLGASPEEAPHPANRTHPLRLPAVREAVCLTEPFLGDL